MVHEFVLRIVEVIAFIRCQYIVVKEMNSIGYCFRSSPYVCMIEKCIVFYELKLKKKMLNQCYGR